MMQMKQVQMNKKEIGKEIEVLIRSIKLHYDNIAEEVRIPSIELELITAKISKLHDKSIIFNHLHYMEEQFSRMNDYYQDDEPSDDETPEENFKINASEIPTPLATPHVMQEPTPIAQAPHQLSEAQLPIEPVLSHTITETITPAQPTIPSTSPIAQSNEMVGKDLKKIIGFSDKYFFISQLFAGDADSFNIEINNLNFCATNSAATSHLDKLQIQKGWTSDNEALQSLKRYMITKYN